MNCLLTLDHIFETSWRFGFSTRPRLLVEKPKRREVSKIRSKVSKQFRLQCNNNVWTLSLHAENGIDGLQFTKPWLERAYLKHDSGACPSSSSPAASASSSLTPATPAAILNCAYMELFEWDENQVFPEVGGRGFGNGACMDIYVFK